MASPQNEIPTQASKQSLPKYEITEQLDEQLSLVAKHRDLKKTDDKKPDYRFSEITTLQRQENCCELFDEKTPPIFRTQSFTTVLTGIRTLSILSPYNKKDKNHKDILYALKGFKKMGYPIKHIIHDNEIFLINTELLNQFQINTGINLSSNKKFIKWYKGSDPKKINELFNELKSIDLDSNALMSMGSLPKETCLLLNDINIKNKKPLTPSQKRRRREIITEIKEIGRNEKLKGYLYGYKEKDIDRYVEYKTMLPLEFLRKLDCLSYKDLIKVSELRTDPKVMYYWTTEDFEELKTDLQKKYSEKIVNTVIEGVFMPPAINLFTGKSQPLGNNPELYLQSWFMRSWNRNLTELISPAQLVTIKQIKAAFNN